MPTHRRSPHRIAPVCLALLLISALGTVATAAESQKIATFFSATSPDVPAALLRDAGAKPWQGKEAGPVSGLQVLAEEKSGVVWLGSKQGAARFDPRAPFRWDRWQYFFGRRWLLDNDVRNLLVVESGGRETVWIRTATGVARIEWRPMSLAEKARLFEERIDQRHVRYGMVASSHLRVPGDLKSNVTRSDDNDGLWTSVYLGAEAYRFAVTKDPDARAKAQRSLRLLMRLEEITGISGFPARSFVSAKEAVPNDGVWHPTADSQWFWKGDTSSDELVGHYFGYALYYDLVADAAEKEAIRQVVGRLTDHLVNHHFDLIDITGKPTRWGRWSEDYFKTEEGKYESALRAVELLSFLKTAQHITGRYQDVYADRINHGYAELMRNYRRWPGGGEINFSDDELAYLSYDPLLRYEQDPKLRALYLDGLRFTWNQIRPDLNPLWNYISAADGAGRLTRELGAESRRTLERIPIDQIEWSVQNSHRRDLKSQPANDRFDRPQLVETPAPDERPIGKWNNNPYRPDGGAGGSEEDDGSYFLLPYWMGRYHGWIK